jgi:hypothetical protein
MSGRASWTAAVLLGVLAGLGALALVGPGASDHQAPGRIRPAARPARLETLDVLHDWDRSRARAWAAGDPAALRRLYADGSGAGLADARLLRRYVARGLVVRRMVMQVLAVRVLESGPRRIRMVVTDRLAGGVAVGGDRQLRLPGDTASTRTLELRRVAGEWRMVAVRSGGASGG